ncbi:CAP domain-containing protein [Chaetomium sp. MPI-CAGE-AT-0009]|nr:CAP domain-containing protein [Chaetomium sp. MPI-CAGE-AT-0009]
MKSSVFLATCGAILAAASPILQGRKLYIKTDVVTEWVTVTVTDGDTSTTFRRPSPRPQPTTTTTPAEPSTTTLPPPPPPPASSPEPVVEAASQPTSKPEPQPSPKPTPVVKPAVPSPDPAPAPAPSPDPAPAPAPSPDPAPAPAPSPTKDETTKPSDYSSTAVYHHNVHRFNHSANALQWDDEIAGYAKTLAERCVFEHDTEIGGGGYGQNLAMWGSSENPEAFGATASVARATTNGWYNGELNDFPASDYGKDSPNMANFKKWGHFTQVVWRETKKVGCHSHFCPPGTMSGMGSWYTVCNYSPAGNMGGAYADNVKPPQGQSVFAAE